MTADIPSLDELRRQIDEIDVALHGLLMQRTGLAECVGQAKGEGTAFLRPGREAQILRGLIERHHGPFPKVVVVRIWREIISAAAALQDPFTVAVFVGEEAPDAFKALARAHYGSERPISGHASAMGVLRAVSDGEATLGVLPLPRGDERTPWWRSLTRSGPKVPKVIARLPFADCGAGRDGQQALAVALLPPEESGRDRSYLVIENPGRLSRGAFKELLAEAGLEVLGMQICWAENEVPQVLVEAQGFLDMADARLARLRGAAESAIGALWPIGAYAVPLSAEELGGEAAVS